MLGTNSRFYYPTLPALAWLAALAFARAGTGWFVRFREAKVRLLAFGAALLVLGVVPALVDAREFESAKRIDAERRNLPTLLRIAPHYYNTESEVRGAIERLASLIR